MSEFAFYWFLYLAACITGPCDCYPPSDKQFICPRCDCDVLCPVGVGGAGYLAFGDDFFTATRCCTSLQGRLKVCATPSHLDTASCEIFDWDLDGDVDLRDYGKAIAND